MAVISKTQYFKASQVSKWSTNDRYESTYKYYIYFYSTKQIALNFAVGLSDFGPLQSVVKTMNWSPIWSSIIVNNLLDQLNKAL